MSDAYNRELRKLAHEVASKLGYSDFLREGVYCVLGGPSFETIAECRMLHSLGADAVGECQDFFNVLKLRVHIQVITMKELQCSQTHFRPHQPYRVTQKRVT